MFVTPLISNTVSIAGVSGPIAELIKWSDVDVDAKIAPGAVDRLLPFLQSSKGNEPSFLENLDQYISAGLIAGKAGGRRGGAAGRGRAPYQGQVDPIPAQARAELKTFTLRVLARRSRSRQGGRQQVRHIRTVGPDRSQDTQAGRSAAHRRIRLLQARLLQRDVRLSLAKDARLDLAYGKVASGGRAERLVDEFGAARRARPERRTPTSRAARRRRHAVPLRQRRPVDQAQRDPGLLDQGRRSTAAGAGRRGERHDLDLDGARQGRLAHRAERRGDARQSNDPIVATARASPTPRDRTSVPRLRRRLGVPLLPRSPDRPSSSRARANSPTAC